MMTAKRLRTEYLYEPIGIDITKPRFYWNCECGEKTEDGAYASGRQTAYQIVVTRDNELY